MPNGIDDFYFENAPEKKNTPAGEIRLIQAGRINRNKNARTTAQAVGILKEKLN